MIASRPEPCGRNERSVQPPSGHNRTIGKPVSQKIWRQAEFKPLARDSPWQSLATVGGNAFRSGRLAFRNACPRLIASWYKGVRFAIESSRKSPFEINDAVVGGSSAMNKADRVELVEKLFPRRPALAKI